MGIAGNVKGSLIKSALSTLTHGNAGSNLLGAVAVSLLGSNLNFGLLTDGLKTEASSIEVGKALGLIMLAVWSYFIGRDKKDKSKENKESEES